MVIDLAANWTLIPAVVWLAVTGTLSAVATLALSE
jgi:hypothetical protein